MISKQIGTDPQTQLLYQISKQLDRLIKIMSQLSNTVTTTTTIVP